VVLMESVKVLSTTLERSTLETGRGRILPFPRLRPGRRLLLPVLALAGLLLAGCTMKVEKEVIVLEDEGKCREFLRLHPSIPAAHYALGVAVAKKGETDEAIKEFREAIRLNPDYAEAHYILGVALSDKGETDEAIKEYRETIRSNPYYAEAHYNLGVELGKKGETDEAIKEYREAIRSKPDYALAHYNLACCYALQGKKEEALQSLAKAVDYAYEDWPLMEKDEDLNSLMEDSRFKELAKKVKARWEEKQKKEGKGKKPD